MSRVTDSAWFWATLFVCGALAILTIAGPQIDRRQQRLDRQFLARQQSGQSIQQIDPADSNDRFIPIRPITWGLAATTSLLTAGYWLRRWQSQTTRPPSSAERVL